MRKDSEDSKKSSLFYWFAARAEQVIKDAAASQAKIQEGSGRNSLPPPGRSASSATAASATESATKALKSAAASQAQVRASESSGTNSTPPPGPSASSAHAVQAGRPLSQKVNAALRRPGRLYFEVGLGTEAQVAAQEKAEAPVAAKAQAKA